MFEKPFRVEVKSSPKNISCYIYLYTFVFLLNIFDTFWFPFVFWNIFVYLWAKVCLFRLLLITILSFSFNFIILYFLINFENIVSSVNFACDVILFKFSFVRLNFLIHAFNAFSISFGCVRLVVLCQIKASKVSKT